MMPLDLIRTLTKTGTEARLVTEVAGFNLRPTMWLEVRGHHLDAWRRTGRVVDDQLQGLTILYASSAEPGDIRRITKALPRRPA
jgi:hypothetical protein